MGCHLGKPKILRMSTDPANLPTAAGDALAPRQPKLLERLCIPYSLRTRHCNLRIE